MSSQLVVLALMLIQGLLGAKSCLSAARSLESSAQLCPLEVNPSLQPAAQIPMSSPQPSGPQAHQKVQLPREMPPYIILKETAAQGPLLPEHLVVKGPTGLRHTMTFLSH